jgi:hypothetical protein
MGVYSGYHGLSDQPSSIDGLCFKPKTPVGKSDRDSGEQESVLLAVKTSFPQVMIASDPKMSERHATGSIR